MADYESASRKDLYDRIKEALEKWKADIETAGQELPPNDDIRSDVNEAVDTFLGESEVDDGIEEEEDEDPDEGGDIPMTG